MKTAEEILAIHLVKVSPFGTATVSNPVVNTAMINAMEEYADQFRKREGSEYWKQRCILAERCLEESPCDPDITSTQIQAWGNYNAFIKENGNK